MIIKNCLNCKKEFKTYVSKIKLGRGKYCSKSCNNISQLGKCVSPLTQFKKGEHRSPTTEFKKGSSSWNKGKTNYWLIGEKNHQWKGGISKHSLGYLNQKSGINKRKLQHRLIMEQYLGHELSSDEIVHHLDGDKTNNNLENLIITNRKDHARFHLEERDYNRWI